MTFLKYYDWNPRPESEAIIEHANAIIEEYQANDYVLTLRQLYYQFVARDLIPNSERSYKNLGSVITKGRDAGMISWDAIEDRNRGHNSFEILEDERELIDTLEFEIQFDRWARQDHYIEVWVEKEALGNVIEKACTPYQVPFMSCKGYLSASEAWRAGQRLYEKAIEDEKTCVVIHLGDHDPSGIDMTRDNRQRLGVYSGLGYGVEINLNRIALNYRQVEEKRPPPNPTKITDSRAKDYMRMYGKTCWELDALEPDYLVKLIQNKIKQYIDPDIWTETAQEENEKRRLLRSLSNNWDSVQNLLENL